MVCSKEASKDGDKADALWWLLYNKTGTRVGLKNVFLHVAQVPFF